VALPAQKYMEAAREIWQKLGLPPLQPKTPWYGYSLGYWGKEDQENAELAVRGEYQKVARRLQKKASRP
jgi:4-hydroxy-3-polyprenylbenzoate decarboxylase